MMVVVIGPRVGRIDIGQILVRDVAVPVAVIPVITAAARIAVVIGIRVLRDGRAVALQGRLKFVGAAGPTSSASAAGNATTS